MVPGGGGGGGHAVQVEENRFVVTVGLCGRQIGVYLTSDTPLTSKSAEEEEEENEMFTPESQLVVAALSIHIPALLSR